MIQEIYPHRLNNHYEPKEIQKNDYLFIFHEGKVLLEKHEELFYIPRWETLQKTYGLQKEQVRYLFSIDEEGFYLYVEEGVKAQEPYSYGTKNEVRDNAPWAKYGFAVALHLHQYYDTHKICGKCGQRMRHDEKERMMRCDHCNTMVFPTISPGIIVAVRHEDTLLLTKYAGREFTNHALIAGFCEVGETLEECVQREVLEEVGLKVKNIRYYGNQPWPYSQSLLVGFVADLDGDTNITLEEEELSYAGWFTRENMPPITQYAGITQHMMQSFIDGEI